jgi:predicted transposase/invertase (TIGR01784 family)
MTYAQELIKIGKEEGMQKGKQIGMQEGKQEERFSMAKKMFQEGIAVSVIKKITGFNETALENLLQTSL